MARRGSGPRLRWRRGQWSIMWTEGGGTRERRTGTADRAAAEEAFADWLAARRERPKGPRRPDAYLVADLLSDYLVEHAPHTASPETIAQRVDRLLDWWGEATVAEISKSSCQGYTTFRREAKISDSTSRAELAVLSAAATHAIKSGRLAMKPIFWLPRQGPGRDRWLTRSEAARLLWAARYDEQGRRQPYMIRFILLALYGGARSAAVLSLTWEQIDLDRGTLNWRPAGQGQTSKGRSAIRLPRRLMTFLRLWARQASYRIGPVITRGKERSRKIASIKKGFAVAAKSAGLATKAGKIDVTPHTLRHTCGTWQAQAGVPLWQIAGYLGHSVARTTELYAHHHPDHMEDSRRALDAGGRRDSVANSVAGNSSRSKDGAVSA